MGKVSLGPWLRVYDGSSYVVEVQVGEYYIRNIIGRKTCSPDRTQQRIVTVQVVMAKEPGILLVAQTGINQNQPIAIFDQ